MKKILIAISSEFARETYSQLFLAKNFEVFKAADGDEAIKIYQENNIDVAILDAELPKINGFEVLKKIRSAKVSSRTPAIIFAQIDRKEERLKAIDLEANDFVAAAITSPTEVVRRVLIILGEQKSYRIGIQKNVGNAKELITDFGYTYDLKCPKCGNDLVLYLIRDLSKGEDYFKISFICPECDFRP